MTVPLKSIARSRLDTMPPAIEGAEDAGRTVQTPAPVDASTWIEPGTGRAYPMSYAAYRRAREAEEKPLPRHRTLGPDVDRYLWRRWRGAAAPEVDIILTVRADAPPRVRRIVAEVLLAIRRGQSAGHAIRRVSWRFGLRHSRALECIAASLGFEARARQDALSPAPAVVSSLRKSHPRTRLLAS